MFYPLMVAGGVFWALAYVLIIRRGFIDGTYGMPVAALCTNLSWEFLFAFVFPQGPVQTPVNVVWFSLDLLILAQVFIYGPREFPRLSRRVFYVAFLVGLLTAFLAVLAVTVELRDYDGVYTAFGMNFMMSILFLWMLYSRGSLRGQSPWIGISKMAGTACNSAAFWLFTSGDSVLLPFLFVSILLFDALYVLCAFRLRGQEKAGFAGARAVG
jgi:hypothetical protein